MIVVRADPRIAVAPFVIPNGSTKIQSIGMLKTANASATFHTNHHAVDRRYFVASAIEASNSFTTSGCLDAILFVSPRSLFRS